MRGLEIKHPADSASSELAIPSECTRCFVEDDHYCPLYDKEVEKCPEEK